MLQNSVFHPSALALMSFFPQCCSFCSPTLSQESTGEPEGDEAAAGYVPLRPQGAERQSAADGG